MGTTSSIYSIEDDSKECKIDKKFLDNQLEIFDYDKFCDMAQEYENSGNLKMARLYYKCAANGNYGLAKYKLGMLCLKLEDVSLAEKCFLDCKDARDPGILNKVMFELGKMYETKNSKMAIEYYYKATLCEGYDYRVYKLIDRQDSVDEKNMDAFVSLGRLSMKDNVTSAFKYLLMAYCFKQSECVKNMLKKVINELHIDKIQLGANVAKYYNGEISKIVESLS